MPAVFPKIRTLFNSLAARVAYIYGFYILIFDTNLNLGNSS